MSSNGVLCLLEQRCLQQQRLSRIACCQLPILHGMQVRGWSSVWSTHVHDLTIPTHTGDATSDDDGRDMLQVHMSQSTESLPPSRQRPALPAMHSRKAADTRPGDHHSDVRKRRRGKKRAKHGRKGKQGAAQTSQAGAAASSAMRPGSSYHSRQG